MTATTWTINAIKDAVRATGSHWFDPSTMRFFGTKVLPTVYQGPGGVYFVTSEQPPHGPRAFTVRSFNPETADIGTVGEVCSINTKGKASDMAKKAAAGIGWMERSTDFANGVTGEYTTTTEAFTPITVLDQFAHDLQKHTNPSRGTETATVEAADKLMRLAKQHHRLMELLCSDEAFCRGVDEEGDHPQITECRKRIAKLVAKLPHTGVVFSGDPRGCTVKLTFADGYTNDFGKEGYCVPIEE
jgi:hypothetical protein